MHALRMAVTAKMFAGVTAPAPKTTPHTRQRENMPWHFRTRDVLKPPDNEAGIQPESSHAHDLRSMETMSPRASSADAQRIPRQCF